MKLCCQAGDLINKLLVLFPRRIHCSSSVYYVILNSRQNNQNISRTLIDIKGIKDCRLKYENFSSANHLSSVVMLDVLLKQKGELRAIILYNAKSAQSISIKHDEGPLNIYFDLRKNAEQNQ